MKIYERQTHETVQSYEAFKVYMNLGIKRSLVKVCEETGKGKSCIAEWSSKHKWVKRVLAYERDMSRLQIAENENRIKKALKRHADTGELFQTKSIEVLKSLNIKSFNGMNPLQLCRLLDISIDMERKALGIASVTDEVKLNQSQERLDIHKRLMNEDIDNLEDSSGFIEGIENIGNNIWSKGNTVIVPIAEKKK